MLSVFHILNTVSKQVVNSVYQMQESYIKGVLHPGSDVPTR